MLAAAAVAAATATAPLNLARLQADPSRLSRRAPSLSAIPARPGPAPGGGGDPDRRARQGPSHGVTGHRDGHYDC